MKNFLKPTKTTWTTFIVLVFIGILFTIFANTVGQNESISSGSLFDLILAIYFVLVFLPAAVFNIFGLNTINSGALAYPNNLGHIIDIIFYLTIFYLIASLFSKIKNNKNVTTNTN